MKRDLTKIIFRLDIFVYFLDSIHRINSTISNIAEYDMDNVEKIHPSPLKAWLSQFTLIENRTGPCTYEQWLKNFQSS